MFGEGQARIYNLVSVFFVTLSVLWLVFVLLQVI